MIPEHKEKFDELYGPNPVINFPKQKKLNYFVVESLLDVEPPYEIIPVPREIVEAIFANGWKMALLQEIQNKEANVSE